MRSCQDTLRGDAKAQVRVKTLNTLLNSGHDLNLLDDQDVDNIWESIFFALWYAEMGRGCEEIIAAVERACSASYSLTRGGFKTIARYWFGLDQYRIDKVSHLSRHLVPVLLDHQIEIWLKNGEKSKRLGTQDVSCEKLLKRTLFDISKSHGLCYFILENLADEISKSLTLTYERLNIITGKFELKANLIIFLYRQVISFAWTVDMDARLLRTFDQYVIKRFLEEILPCEAQLTQILVSLRLYQALDHKREKVCKKPQSGRCIALFKRWSSIIQQTHEKCINGEYFVTSYKPIKNSIRLGPHLHQPNQ